MKKSKLIRMMLRVLGVSSIALGILISNIPQVAKAVSPVVEFDQTDKGMVIGVVDKYYGDGVLVLPDSATSIQYGHLVFDQNNAPVIDPNTGSQQVVNGAFENCKLKSLTISKNIRELKVNTFSDYVPQPNAGYDTFDSEKSIEIFIPRNITYIAAGAIVCRDPDRTIYLRSYEKTTSGQDCVAKIYAENYSSFAPTGGGKVEFRAIPEQFEVESTIEGREKIAASFVRAGTEVSGGHKLKVQTIAGDLTNLQNIPAISSTGAIRLFYDITLVDYITNAVITKNDFAYDTVKVTLPVPASIDMNRYKLAKVYTNNAEGKIEEVSFVSDTTRRTVSFTSTHLSNFLLEYTPIAARPAAASLANATMALEKDGDYTYTIFQKDVTGISDTAGVPPLIENGKRSFYEIVLVNNVTGALVTDGASSFGSARISIPLANDVNLTNFKLNQVYTVGSNGAYEKISGATTTTDPATKTSFVNFTATHFSEYVVEYAAVADPNANQNQQNQNQNQNQQNPGQNADQNQNQNQDQNANQNQNQDQTQQNQNQQQNQTQNQNQQNQNQQQTTQQQNQTQNQNQQNNTAGTTDNTTQGTTTTNRVDMPRTADLGTVSNIIVIMMIVSGIIMVMLSFPMKKKEKVHQN